MARSSAPSPRSASPSWDCSQPWCWSRPSPAGCEGRRQAAKGSILGEMATTRHTALGDRHRVDRDARPGGRAAFARLLAVPGVLEKVVTTARQCLAADLVSVPVTLRDGTAAGLRPIYPGDQYALVTGERLFSVKTRYQRFIGELAWALRLPDRTATVKWRSSAADLPNS